MSEIKALEKLRKYTLRDEYGRLMAYTKAYELADEIQAEIGERFMELPVDADGVPIRVGEHVRGKYTDDKAPYKVHGFMFDFEHGQWNIALNESRFASSNLLICVKPRTLQDVIAEYKELSGKQEIKDYFEVSKELRDIQREQFKDKPELELYKEVHGYEFYIELPYDELQIMTDDVEVKHHSYSYMYKHPNGCSTHSCSSLCGHSREWAIERLDESIKGIERDLMDGDDR